VKLWDEDIYTLIHVAIFQSTSNVAQGRGAAFALSHPSGAYAAAFPDNSFTTNTEHGAL
jgi:hypothetical protein